MNQKIKAGLYHFTDKATEFAVVGGVVGLAVVSAVTIAVVGPIAAVVDTAALAAIVATVAVGCSVIILDDTKQHRDSISARAAKICQRLGIATAFSLPLIAGSWLGTSSLKDEQQKTKAAELAAPRHDVVWLNAASANEDRELTTAFAQSGKRVEIAIPRKGCTRVTAPTQSPR